MHVVRRPALHRCERRDARGSPSCADRGRSEDSDYEGPGVEVTSLGPPTLPKSVDIEATISESEPESDDGDYSPSHPRAKAAKAAAADTPRRKPVRVQRAEIGRAHV